MPTHRRNSPPTGQTAPPPLLDDDSRRTKRRKMNPAPEPVEVIDLVDSPPSTSRPLRQRPPRPAPHRPFTSPEIVIDDDEPAPSLRRLRPAAPFRAPRSRAAAPPRARAAARGTSEAGPSTAQMDDLALARRLQAEEEARVAQEDRAMRWRLNQLEREEAAAEAAAATAPRIARPMGRSRGAGGAGPSTGPRSGRRNRWARGPVPLPFPGGMFGGGGAPDDDEEDAGVPLPFYGGGAGAAGGGGGFGGFGGFPGFPRGGPFASLFSDLAALHQAVTGARAGVLPPHLLFSDADFGEEDYEMLLKLDEGVENRRGASKDAINQLQMERVPRGAAAPAYDDCVVCLDGIGGGQTVRRLECGHAFHKGCIDKWLRQKACCPICQRAI